MSNQAASEVKRALTDPAKLCAALGIDKGSKRQLHGRFICCPVHAERSPSCSVSLAEDGSIRVKCFGCDFTGDALTLIGIAKGLSLRTEFKEILIAGAEIAGLHALADDLRAGRPRDPAAPRASAAPTSPLPPERTYPPADEVEALWGACEPVTDSPDATFELVSRRLDPEQVARADLARAIHRGAALPGWARYQGRTWFDTGHRMILPVFDDHGVRQSVRAYRVTKADPDVPKRLPPAGHKAVGLVLANGPAVGVLTGAQRLFKFVVVEGEPDFLVHAVRTPELPVLGLFSGSWHAGFAERIPRGSEVIIRTHHDAPGEKYSEQVVATVRDRAIVRRAAA